MEEIICDFKCGKIEAHIVELLKVELKAKLDKISTIVQELRGELKEVK